MRPGLKALVCMLVALSIVSLRGQSTSNSASFEAASVKRNRSGGATGFRWQTGGTEFRATNLTLRAMLRQAFGLWQPSEVIGGPDWIDVDRFDIVAKAERPNTPFLPMLRTLLAERFKLVTHREMRDLPIYTLVIAAKDGHLGPKLRRSTTDCTPRKAGEGAKPEPTCGFRPGLGVLVGDGIPLSLMIPMVASAAQRRVVDRTGLTGNFSIDLHWTQENPQPPDAPTAVDSDAPAIFTALQEQLGLKLEPGTGPVEVLVITSVERPTDD